MAAVVMAAALMLVIGAAPLLVRGADHLDAPGLTSPQARSDADINDVYAFAGVNEARSVLAVTTHPGAGAIAPLKYARDVKYKMNIDKDGDALADVTYVWRFGKARRGSQPFTVRRTPTGGRTRVVAEGRTGRGTKVAGGGRAFAGLRSDPFFFDLDAFRGAVLGEDNDRTFCDQDGDGIDFFAALNTNALVLEVPDGRLGQQIGVWATTVGADGQIDRMGRPAINAVFNSGEDKNAFNAGRPADDLANFSDNVAGVLETFSGLDTEGEYTETEIDTLVSVLLPDMLTYDTATAAAGPLNGRALADDVIDAELNIVTGGFAFEGRDATGAITGDCVEAHTDLLGTFPYLGVPH